MFYFRLCLMYRSNHITRKIYQSASLRFITTGYYYDSTTDLNWSNTTGVTNWLGKIPKPYVQRPFWTAYPSRAYVSLFHFTNLVRVAHGYVVIRCFSFRLFYLPCLFCVSFFFYYKFVFITNFVFPFSKYWPMNFICCSDTINLKNI